MHSAQCWSDDVCIFAIALERGRADLRLDMRQPPLKESRDRGLIRLDEGSGIQPGDDAGQSLLRFPLARSIRQRNELDLTLARLVGADYRIPVALAAFTNMPSHFFLRFGLTLFSSSAVSSNMVRSL